MKFYDETQLLYLETDAFGIGLGAAILQTRSRTSCPRDKSQLQHMFTHHIYKQEPLKC